MKSIKVNAILNAVNTLCNIIFPVLTFPYVTRILSSDGFGKVSFFQSVSNYSIMLASLGLSLYGVRTIAQVRKNKNKLSNVVVELCLINFILTGLVISLLSLSFLYVIKFSEEPMLFAMSLCVIAFAPLTMEWFYVGMEEYVYILKRSVFLKIISLILIFLFVKTKADYVSYFVILGITTIGTGCINCWYAKSYISLKNIVGLNLKRHIKPMLLIFSSVLAVNVYTTLDIIMLGFICGDVQVGMYTLATKVKWLLLTLINSLSAVLLPRLSYYVSNGEETEYNELLRKSTNMVLFLTLPIAFFFIFNSWNTAIIIGGEAFVGASVCMKILMPIIIISGVSNVVGNQILLPHNKENLFLRAVATGAFLNIILNWVLMGKYGCIGASVATLIAEITQMSVQVYCAKDYFFKSFQIKEFCKYIVAAVVASIVLMISMVLLKQNVIFMFVCEAVLFGISYLILCKIFGCEAIRMFQEFFRVKYG